MHVLVLGDLMIDAYYYGKVDRISPEAPVPVVSVSKKEYRLGGAANVGMNVIALGAKATLCGVTGNDAEGKLLKELAQKDGLLTSGIFTENSRPTTVKTRIIGNNHHVLRVDSEVTSGIRHETYAGIIDFVNQTINNYHVIVLEDYNKGVLRPEVISAVIGIAEDNNVPVCVDPKLDNFLNYTGVTLFKPNRKEVKEGLKMDEDLSDPENVAKAIRTLSQKLNCKHVLITLSENGVMIGNNLSTIHVAAHPRKIIDVSGAGDTVISVAALCLAAGADAPTIAAVSNLAGGLVCEKLGVVPIDKSLLKREAALLP